MSARPGFAIRRGHGLPLIFVHGSGVDHHIFDDLDPVFERVGGFERIYLDQPGFGRTPPDPSILDLDGLARWLDDQVDIFSGGGPFALVGNSLGGLLSRHAAAGRLDRCRGMALLSSVVDPVTARRRLPPRQVLVRDDQGLADVDEFTRHAYRQMAVVESRQHLEAYQRTIMPGIRSADADTVARMEGHYRLDMDFDQVWSGFIAPALFVCGRQDDRVGYLDQFDLACRFPRASYSVLDQAGHNVQIEQTALVCDLLEDWARQVPKG